MKRLLIPLLTLAILGAGCAPQTPAPSQPSTSTPNTGTPSTTTPPTGSTTTPEPTPSGSTQLTPATTDSSWHTYNNAVLNFSFMWPTKGHYAPEWEVKFLKDTDAQIKGDCYVVEGGQVNEPKMVSAGGQAFCHTSANEGAAGSIYFTDAYATKIGSTEVVILFTKHVYSAGAIPNCSGAEFSSASNACVPFVAAEYEAFLDGIIGTFMPMQM
jgi:hypothetical protein